VIDFFFLRGALCYFLHNKFRDLFISITASSSFLYTMSSSNDDTNRVMNRVMELKRSLEKSVKSDDMSAGYVLDQLCALEKLDLGANIITDSKLGKVLLNLKKKFTDVSEDVCNKAKDIMVEWKRIIETHKERSTPSSSALASGQGQPQQPKVPSVAVGAGSGDPEKPKAEANPPRAATSTAPTPKQSQILSLDSSAMLVFASLPEPRKKVLLIRTCDVASIMAQLLLLSMVRYNIGHIATR
jgi:hypothetical protein